MYRVYLPEEHFTIGKPISQNLDIILGWCKDNNIDFVPCNDIRRFLLERKTGPDYIIVPWAIDGSKVWLDFYEEEDALAFKLKWY